jgi:hypothetical protein
VTRDRGTSTAGVEHGASRSSARPGVLPSGPFDRPLQVSVESLGRDVVQVAHHGGQYLFIALWIFAYANAACANSCANVEAIGTFDRSGLEESEYGISAVGTFRIEGEAGKQPMFNLAIVECEKQFDDKGKASFECKVMQAAVWATSDKPRKFQRTCWSLLHIVRTWFPGQPCD